MGLSSKLSCEARCFSSHHNPHKVLQPEILRLYLPLLEPWVVWSILLPSCSSHFIRKQMWDHWVYQPPPCQPRSSSHNLATSPLCPSYLSLPLLPVWMNVSSLTPCLLNFHTIWFSGSSGYFLFLNLLFSFLCCARRQSVSTYASTLAGKWNQINLDVITIIHVKDNMI